MAMEMEIGDCAPHAGIVSYRHTVLQKLGDALKVFFSSLDLFSELFFLFSLMFVFLHLFYKNDI